MKITVSMSGLAHTRLIDGDYHQENPEIWARMEWTEKRQGRGFTHTVTAELEDIVDLGEYLASVWGAEDAALGDMEVYDEDTKRDKDNARRTRDAVRTATLRIEEATGWSVRGYSGGRTEPKS